MNIRIAALAPIVGGLLVGTVLHQPRTGDFAYVVGGDRLDALLYSDATAVALAAVAAVLVARLSRARIPVVLGVLVLTVPLVAASSANLYLNGLGAGLVLGGLLGLAGSSAFRCSALATGVVLGAINVLDSTPRGYADYSGADASIGVIAILLAVTAVLAVLPAGPPNVRDASSGVDRRGIIVGIGIPIVALVVQWLYVRSLADRLPFTDLWPVLLSGAIVIGFVIAAVLWLPRSVGVALLVGVAVASVDTRPVVSMDRWGVAVAVVAAMLALLAGHLLRAPESSKPVFGLAAVGMPAIVAVGSPELATLMLPAAAAFAYSYGFAASDDGVPVRSVAVPAILASLWVVLPFDVDYGWTAYTPSDFGWTAFGPSTTWLTVQSAAGVVVTALCVAIAWIAGRRALHPEDNAGNA